MKNTLIIMLALAFVKIGYSQNYKFGKVSKEELEEQYYPLDSTANAAYLYKKRRTYTTIVGGNSLKLVTDIQVRLKVYNKEGFDWSTVKINLFGNSSSDKEETYGIKAVTYNLIDGNIEESKLDRKDIFIEQKSDDLKVEKFTMPNVKEGSVIEWTYKIQSPYISSIDDIVVQHEIPVKKMEESIALLEWFYFNKRQKGYYPFEIHQSVKFNQTLKTNDNVIEVLEENIPALKNEPYVNNMSNYTAALQLEIASISAPELGIFKNYASSWEEIAKNILANSSFGGELKKSRHLEDDLEKLKVEFTNEESKITGALEFVKSKIKWNGNFGKNTENGLKKAYAEGTGNIGDINLTLVGVLRELGLDADPVLVSTRSNGVPIVPTNKGFNYVIAVVHTNEGKVLLDASDKFSLPNVLPLRALNWKGTIIKDDGTIGFVDLVTPIISNIEYNLNYKINEEGLIEGVNRKIYKNLETINYRNEKNSIEEDELISAIEQNNDDIEILSFRLTNLDKISKPIIEMYQFEKEDGAEIIGDKMYVSPMLFTAIKENPFKLDVREYPIDFGAPWQKTVFLSIEIPEGYNVASIPENIAIGMSEDTGKFIYSIKIEGNNIKLQSLIKINKGIVPAQYYEEIKGFYKVIVDKSTEKIVLVKG